MLNNTYYGSYRSRTFSEIYPNFDKFKEDYDTIKFAYRFNKDETLETAYYLLLANYAGSHIASSDENQFRIKVMATLFQYGLTWEKRLELQEEYRKLNIDQIREGSFSIYNSAANPDTQPAEDYRDNGLPFISNQTTTKNKKGIADAYLMFDALLRSDLNRDFIVKFKDLFIRVLAPDYPLLYETVEED